jgi:hypothetical protein
MRGWINYPVAIALGVALGACAEASRQRVNEAAAVEDGGDDGGDGPAARPDTDTASADAARPDAASTDATSRDAASTDAASTDAATADAGARPFVPTMTTDAGPGLGPTVSSEATRPTSSGTSPSAARGSNTSTAAW